MDVVGIIIGLILGAIVYFIAALFLPYIVAILLGVAFGGGRFYNRGV